MVCGVGDFRLVWGESDQVVIMQDPESDTLQQVHTNRAQTWFQVVLWILPSGFATLSLFGIGWIRAELFSGDPSILETVVLIVNLGILFGAGCFNSVLSGTRPMPQEGPIFRIALFCSAQLFLIIPLVWMIALALIYFF